MRISELADSPHAVKAANIHIGINKNKILLVLHSSKTHGKESYPQKIKITALNENGLISSANGSQTKGTKEGLICPFKIVRSFLQMRGTYVDDDENFFVFRDGSKVTAIQVRNTLRDLLKALSLDSSLYDTHSFRIGRTGDLVREGFSVEEIRRAGRWRSGAVYKYLRNI